MTFTPFVKSHWSHRRSLVGRRLALLLAVSISLAADARGSLLYSVGDAETLYSASQRRNKGLNSWIDGSLGVVPIGNGQYHFYGADSTTPVRTTGTLADPGNSRKQVSISGLPSGGFNYVAGGPVYTDAASGKRLMIYHAEKHAGSAKDYYSVLGMAVSTDAEGLKFRDLGLIVEPDVPMAQRPHSIEMGGGSFAVMNDQLYVYYRDYLEGGGSSELAVARASLSAVLGNAMNFQGTAFSKYYNGGWSESGLGGRSSALEVGNPSNAWSAVSYNEYLNGMVMMTSTWADPSGNNDIYMSTSADGVNWTPRQSIVLDAGEQMFPTMIGTGADPTRTGKSFYAYYTDSASGAWNRWNDARLVRREITLDPFISPPPGPDASPNWESVAGYQDDFQRGGPRTGWTYAWSSKGKLGDANKYAALRWSESEGVYNTTGGATPTGTKKDAYLMLTPDSGHPGSSKYYAITGYTIQAEDGAGLYQLSGSSIMKWDTVASSGEDGLDLKVYLNNTALGGVQNVSTSGSLTTFDRALGNLTVGDTVYVMVGSLKNQSHDLFKNFDFSIQKNVLVSLPPVVVTPNPPTIPPSSAPEAWGAVASYKSDYQAGGPAAGWKYAWNSTGRLGDASKYSSLKWSATEGVYNTTGGATPTWNGKGRNDDYLLLASFGGHPGRSKYYTIAGYTIQADDGAGLYRLIASSITKADSVKTGDEDGLNLKVYLNNTLLGSIGSVLTDGALATFDRALGNLVVGDTIYVMIGSLKNQNYDLFANFDFTIERLLPPAAMMAASAPAIYAVPEPAAGMLLMMGAVAGGVVRRRRR